MGTNGGKILVVESDMKLAQGLTRELRARSIEVFSASDAVNALILARKLLPDAVVISSQLAGGGGMLALKRIRSNVFTTNIPVIVAIARGGPNAEEFLSAGAQQCITSPASGEEVHAAMQRNALQPLDFTQAPAEALAEPARLAALAETGLLDSPPEETFDRLTRLASRLLGAGAALVSLVDNERQFFKSQIGLAQPWAGARQTRLTHSFCQWVVSGREQLVVEDANAHPALRGNLAVRDMGVVAYAGVPLKDRNDRVLGSFCAIDARRRAWSDEDLETLRDLGQVSEAYAALDRVKQGVAEPASGSAANLQTSVHVAGKAIIGATRILRRYGARLPEAEHADLLAIIEEQGARLTRLAPHPH